MQSGSHTKQSNYSSCPTCLLHATASLIGCPSLWLALTQLMHSISPARQAKPSPCPTCLLRAIVSLAACLGLCGQLLHEGGSTLQLGRRPRLPQTAGATAEATPCEHQHLQAGSGVQMLCRDHCGKCRALQGRGKGQRLLRLLQKRPHASLRICRRAAQSFAAACGCTVLQREMHRTVCRASQQRHEQRQELWQLVRTSSHARSPGGGGNSCCTGSVLRQPFAFLPTLVTSCCLQQVLAASMQDILASSLP